MRLRAPHNAWTMMVLRPRTQIVWAAPVLVANIQTNSQASSPLDHESWSASSETTSSTMAPSRQLETHIKNGDHVLDTRTIRVPGPGGSYETYSDTESELVHDNASRDQAIPTPSHADTNVTRGSAQVTQRL